MSPPLRIGVSMPAYYPDLIQAVDVPKPIPRALQPGECRRCRRFDGHGDECGLRSPYCDPGQTWDEVQAERAEREKSARDLQHTYRLLGIR